MIPIAKPLVGDEEKRGILEVLESGMLAQGPRVKALEEAFADYCGVRHAVATSSGTTALHLALLAHGIGEGDEVITSPFTFISSANTILFTGAKPVFVDIDPNTFNIDPSQIASAVTPRTRAIMPVHLFGLTADMGSIVDLAEAHDLAIIEDACQAHGAEYLGERAGTFGTGCFSFYPTKNMTAAEGGMITTNDEQVADACRVARQHGMRRRYYHDELGYNYRMTDVHAAIGLAQLQKLERFNQTRIANAGYLTQHLEGVVTPFVPDGYRHVFHQYTIRVPRGRRDALREALADRGIGSAVYYPVPVHRQQVYQERDYTQAHPESERAAEEVLSLPVHPALSRQELGAIVAAVNRFARGA
ncbi:MAG: DegT/DnrJ/EryC1/StrS family aminotransferase [Anaerolineae bacterium]|jgi:dTDP-4-amino-4,6-dideoxygalactose transaminase